MARDRASESTSPNPNPSPSLFANFFTSGLTQVNLLATSLLPNIALSSSLSSLASESSKSVSSSTFYVNIQQEKSATSGRCRKYDIKRRQNDNNMIESHFSSNVVHDEEFRREIESCLGYKMPGRSHCKQSRDRPPYMNYLEHSENYRNVDNAESSLCSTPKSDSRDVGSLVINELKCKLRENKSQIRANRYKLNQGEWSKDLLEGHWDSFVDWRTSLDDHSKQGEGSDSDIASVHSSDRRKNNVKLNRHATVFRSAKLKRNAIGAKIQVPDVPKIQLTHASSIDSSDSSGSFQRWTNQYNLPQEIIKPSDRHVKERTSFRSYTFSKLSSYRSRFAAKKPDLESGVNGSAGDEDTISEISYTASCATEEYDCDSGEP